MTTHTCLMPLADDAPSLDALYREHRRYVAAIALRMLGDVALADDVCQDVFVIALRKRHTLREPAAVRGWLARVAVREAGRALRRRRLRRWVGLDAVPDGARIAPGASPAQQAELSRLYATLDTLPATLRLPWALRYLEGETLPRVAELCGCALATAKRRIAAAHAVVQREVGHG